MTVENELIGKSFYVNLIEGNKNVHPIQTLGEMYKDEKREEVPDFSSIRFAQGEVYFLNKDFEAAIFKWENINNDLKPWALKNIADAHYEMDLFAIAEDYYRQVETDSIILKTEVLLQLFSLYIKLGKLEKAVDCIKNAVDLNPDYSGVTDMARAFFEDYQDWRNAVELAANEAIRTESLTWFEVLEGYIDQGHTVKIVPNYFNKALKTLYTVNQFRFESLSVALWNSYKQTEMYFPWLKEINQLLLDINLETTYIWKKFPDLYKETYFELISGKLLIRHFSELIQNHLTNWIKVSSTSDSLISSTAVLAWNEIFPSHLEASLVNNAEELLNECSHNQNGLEDGFRLYESIKNWAEKEGLVLGEHFDWVMSELLDLKNHHLLITGSVNSERSNLVNMLLNEDIFEEPTSDRVIGNDGNKEGTQSRTDEEVRSISEQIDNRNFINDQQELIPFRVPVSYLDENKLALIDTPSMVRNHFSLNMHFGDSLLFILNPDSNTAGKELEKAVRMREQLPELPIHFLLLIKSRLAGSQKEVEMTMKLRSWIDAYFPHAKVTTLSANNERSSQLSELSRFVKSLIEGHGHEIRTSKILYFIKRSIEFLIEKRVEMENAIIDKINWKEELLAKLNGIHHQLSDMEEEQVRDMKNSFSKMKDEFKQDLLIKITDLLRNCSDIVNEESDFRKIHVELNEEMNKRIADYMDKTVIQHFHDVIQEWMTDCEGTFKECQTYLDEMSESFNYHYGEDKIALRCDFKVLDDWQRDVYRITRGIIHLEKANIMMRTTPSQLFLKSIGTLFGTFSKNKELLNSKYKQFIEGEDYSQTAQSIINPFMQQLELFEKSLATDINMFFTAPVDLVKKTIVEAQADITKNKDSLNKMRKHPETYRDPLTLFELKLRQYELINGGRVPTSGCLVHE